LVFLSDAFLSVVAHREQPGTLLVRARRAGDIEAVFPQATVRCTPRADYRYRAELPAADVAQALAERAGGIDYPNFKSSVRDPRRHAAYADVWLAMRQVQDRD
jgi:hypothetical protein